MRRREKSGGRPSTRADRTRFDARQLRERLAKGGDVLGGSRELQRRLRGAERMAA